ncbi:MAG: hypothetical protein OXI07_04760 [Gammaproteobacteria bacterium]|nr:hypothetical protein [Gammaproteobacteria bacterium]
MQLSDFVSPAIILGVGAFLWRALVDMRRDLAQRIDQLNQRLDNHLEGHAPKP